MDSLALLAVVGAAVALAHLAIAGYLYRRSESLEAALGAETTAAEKSPRDDRVDGVVCPCCGVANDEFYRYCRRWVTDLSTNSAALRGRGGAGGLRS